MGVTELPLHHIPTPCNKNKVVLFLAFFELTPEMKTTKMSPVLESFLLRPGNTSVIYNQLLSSCNNTIIIQLRLHVLYHIWSHLWEILPRITRWCPLGSGHENGGIHWVFFFPTLFSFLPTQVLSSPTDTVLMLVTYHRNFCSHHGHHLCRGKIGDMMAFPLSQLRAQSSPTSPSVCTPARVCDYGGNVSHEECIRLWH